MERSAFRRAALGKRIDRGNPERLEVVDVASHDTQPPYQSSSRTQRIFQVMIGPTMKQLSPATKNVGVCWNDVVCLGDAV